jgi:hypothetical protein
LKRCSKAAAFDVDLHNVWDREDRMGRAQLLLDALGQGCAGSAFRDVVELHMSWGSYDSEQHAALMLLAAASAAFQNVKARLLYYVT